MPSPIRRSARGQLGPASSTTSSLSSRQDRGTRTNQTQKSGTPRSQSSEDLSEPPVARRSQRQPANKEEGSAKDTEAVDDNDEEAIEEEEITRCICGHQDYPGPPLSEAFADIPNAQAEEIGGLFILCDGCSVWQHGGCVGIVEENQSPDKYFCEECRPKQHAVSRDSRGQKYSLYIPLHPKAQRRGSTSKPDDKARKDRQSADPRASVDPSTGKRRGTIRSKELDDEEEQLRQAIEESKREGGTGTGRRGKRARDDSSEDSKQETKRQRRASEALPLMRHAASIEDESDDPDSTSLSRTKKAKADAAQSARQVQQQEKEKERERARNEAASRRQDRARSRRGEDADGTGDTTPKPTSSGKVSPPAPSSPPPTPPPADKAPVKRGPGKKPGKKLGNNQYTKRNLEQGTSSPYGRKRQLQSQATQGSGDEGSEIAVNGGTNGAVDKQSPGAAGTSENTNGKGKFGRGRKTMANGNGVRGTAPEDVERTFTNMQLVLQNISTYVTKQQDDTSVAVEKSTMAIEAGSPSGAGALQAPSTASVSSLADRNFHELSSSEMAVQLQSNIKEWQRQWGHLAST
ncbi:hypothetical protein DOTSEDRAFT_70787 [Dothistroma septosporum NZE10]|uniref:Zinc finger PHD-type domain-containing protein n=1 Tax=Dothistroma septosporum (strain NZE10 / CBS 128990) TaxID=675120 RepID=N1PN38_DOTSN|nr:hypothetical protein DOTSEDRAFT_70787 [Dothistroma septosporum NZE10]